MDEMLEFYASEAMTCPRRIYFRLKGYKEKWPDFVRVRLEQGINTHNVLGDILKRRFGFELEKHIILKSPRLGLEIHGRIDAYKDYPIEIKGKTSLPRIPHDYHLAQLNIYLRWAESEYGYLYYVRLHERPKKVLDGIDFSKFPVVKGKNFKAFEIPYDEKLFKEAVKQFYVIKKHYERGIPPKGWNDYTCRFCPYYYICSGNGSRV